MPVMPLLLTLASIGQVPADVESAARGYRVEIYSQFHLQHDEYSKRREVADELIEDWARSGKPESQAKELVQWFETARDAVRENTAEPSGFAHEIIAEPMDDMKSDDMKSDDMKADKDMKSEDEFVDLGSSEDFPKLLSPPGRKDGAIKNRADDAGGAGENNVEEASGGAISGLSRVR
jgi:hypothetical protein